MADEVRRIHGRALLKALTDAGIIRTGDFVRRVVIDAPCDGAVLVHVERIGDSRLLDVVPTLGGVEVRESHAPVRVDLEASAFDSEALAEAIEGLIQSGRLQRLN